MKRSLLVCLGLLASCGSASTPAPSVAGGSGSAGGGRSAAAAGSGGRGGQAGTAQGGQAGEQTGGQAGAPSGRGGETSLDTASPSPEAGAADAPAAPDVAAGGSDATADANVTADAGPPGALTAGWRQMPFTYAIHKPFDLPESARHSYDAATDTHTFFTLAGDKPHDPPPNTTAARTELRMNNNYRTGLHQFEADFYVVKGTDGPCIMQVFGGTVHATAFMLKAYGGSLKHYDRETMKTAAYDKWLHLNVIHNADTGEVKAYIDGALAGTFKDNGPGDHYFKCGVYGSTSARSESRFRNIKHWVK
jgi:hypothetical protein